MNDHDDVADRLRDVVQALDADGADFDVYELREDEAFEDAPRDRRLIDQSILANILTEWASPED